MISSKNAVVVVEVVGVVVLVVEVPATWRELYHQQLPGIAHQKLLPMRDLEYEKKIFNEIRSLHLIRYLMINRLLSIYTFRIL